MSILSFYLPNFKNLLNFDKEGFYSTARKSLNRASKYMVEYTQKHYFGSSRTNNRIQNQTGNLKNSLRTSDIEELGTNLKGGMTWGDLPYAKVHFGPRGQVTNISAKAGHALAVPFGPGQAFNRSRNTSNSLWSDAPFLHRKGHTLVNANGTVYFKLCKSVKVPARIFPEDIVKNTKKYIGQILRDDLVNYFVKNVGTK